MLGWKFAIFIFSKKKCTNHCYIDSRSTMQEKEQFIIQITNELENKDKTIAEAKEKLQSKADELLSYSDKVASKETEYSEAQVSQRLLVRVASKALESS